MSARSWLGYLNNATDDKSIRRHCMQLFERGDRVELWTIATHSHNELARTIALDLCEALDLNQDFRKEQADEPRTSKSSSYSERP